MNGFPIRRAFSILLRLISLSAASALITGLLIARIGDGTVYAALPGPSALSWLGPCALFCLFAMAAGPRCSAARSSAWGASGRERPSERSAR